MAKPVVFLSNFHSFTTRNILNSGVLGYLSEKTDVVIFVHKYKEQYFKELYQKGNVAVEGVDVGPWVKSRKNKLFIRIAEWLLDTNVRKFHKLAALEKDRNKAKYYFSIIFTKIFNRIKPFKKFIRYLDYWINNPRPFESFFARYKPSAVFVTDIFSDYDLLLLKNARALSVKNVAMVRSWDNTTGVGYLRFAPDKLIVHNEVEKEEMPRYHDISDKTIQISGIPQFEEYLRAKPTSREEFYKKIGADSGKRLILFAPAGNFFIDTDWQICQILKDLYYEGKIPKDIQFIIRLHPFLPADLSQFKPDENFIIDITGSALSGPTLNTKTGGELDKDFYQHLFDSLYYSSLIINTISSIIIDAAALDKPLITINFNGWEKDVPVLKSLKRWRLEENQISWMSFGMTPLVENKEELAEWINKYLDNPTLDSDKRKIFKQAYCGNYDGKSAERIASFVLDCI
ncbi:MAG: CDP-glycerol glycerophosphotransferase family protein [Parcubacteria group bacterium]|nr:CDP-glycerol glycerophosphotransferase family protein [Parcubacteria group bacterium]